jgi:hypothetical protein
MKTLLLCLVIMGTQYTYCNGISKQDSPHTSRTYLSRNSLYVGLKTGFSEVFSTSGSRANVEGFSYSIMPELEYFALKKLSVCFAASYFRSSFQNDLKIEKSTYLGLKKHFTLNQRHAVNINAGVHYGNSNYRNPEFPRSEYNIFGSAPSIGAGYQYCPAKIFGQANRKWVIYMDLTHSFPMGKAFSFSYAGVGVKYLLSKN